MSKDACSKKIPPLKKEEDNVESKLNEALVKAFPSTVYKQKKGEKGSPLVGTSSYYINFREDPAWLDWFGDWTTKEGVEAIRAEAPNEAILDEYDEPVLYEDTAGNPYIRNSKGDWAYVRPISLAISPQEQSELVNTLVGQYVIDPNKNVSAYVADKIKEAHDNLDAVLKERLADIEKVEDPDLMMDLLDNESEDNDRLITLKSIMNNKDIQSLVSRKIKSRLENYNYKYVEDAATKEDEQYVEDKVNDILNFTIDSNEISNRAINDPLILKFLSSFPEFKSYEQDIQEQKRPSNIKRNYLMNSDLYLNQNEVWGMLEGIFSDVLASSTNQDGASKDVFQNFLTVLEHEAKTSQSSALNYAHDYLSNLDKNEEIVDEQDFATKLTTAFFRTSKKYLITQVETVLKGNKYSTSFKMIDPSVKNNKVTKIAEEHIETFSNLEKNNNVKAVKDLRTSLLTEYKELLRRNDPVEFKRFLKKVIKEGLELNVSDDVINHFFRITTGLDDKNPKLGDLKKLLANFLETKLRSHSMKTEGVPFVDGEIELFKYLINKKANTEGLSQKGKVAVKETLMANGSFLKALATSAKLFSKDLSESSFIVGGNKRWAYSAVSSLDMLVDKLKNGDLETINKLKHRNFTFIEYLQSEEGINSRHLIELYNSSEIKNERDNNPTLHKKITEIDAHLDYYAKLFSSRDGFYKESTGKKQGVDSELEQRRVKYRNYAGINLSGDKSSAYAIYGLPIPALDDYGAYNAYNIDKKSIGSPVKKILDGYLDGEIKEASNASQKIIEYMGMKPSSEKTQYLMDNLIPGFHYNIERYSKKEAEDIGNPDLAGMPKRDIEQDDLIEKDFKNGSYHRLGIFAPAVDMFEEVHPKMLTSNAYGFPVIDINILNSPFYRDLAESVYAIINEKIASDHKYLSDVVLVKRKDDEGESMEISLFDIGTNIANGTKDEKIYQYIISSFLVNYEFSNILSGHLGYYKQKDPAYPDLTDYLKRAPAIATDGKYLRHRNRRQNAIDKLEEGQKLSEKQLSQIQKKWKNYSMEEQIILDADDSNVVAIVNNMDVNVSKFAENIEKGTGAKNDFPHEIADAQGVMTPVHFKDVLSRIYGWSPNDTKMHNELMDPNHKVTPENFNWIKTGNKSATPLKMVYFGVNEKGEPVYLKYSLAPLYPALVNGTEVEKILKQMEAQGVEQVVFQSGSKASNPPATTIHEGAMEGKYDGLKQDFKFNPFLIDSIQLKMQVELPTKMDKQTKLGIQSIKNILTNIDMNNLDKVYSYDGIKLDSQEYQGQKLTGQQIYDEVQKSAVNLLQTGLDRALDKLGYRQDKLTGAHDFDVQKVKKLLSDEMDIEQERDLIHLLKTDLPIETVPNLAQRAFPKISAYLTKTAGKIYTNGGSVVQVANLGFDRLSADVKSEVFYLGEQTAIKPPLPVTNEKGEVLYFNEKDEPSIKKEKGYHMKIDKAKVLMPFSSIFKETGLSYKEFQDLWSKGLIDEKIFKTIMGYRIPNQSMASNDSFEIIGLLPPIAGDQAVVYHEITAKTGSDFDIDKMYLATANFEVEFEKSSHKKANEYIKELNLSEDDMLEILGAEGFEDDYEMYESEKEVREVFKAAILFNSKTIEGDAFAKKYGDQKLKRVKYSTEGHKGAQNQFVELMNAVIESPKSYNDLMSPLDSDIVKDTINETTYLKSLDVIEREKFRKLSEEDRSAAVKKYTKENKLSAIEQLMPVALTKSRTDMLEAKTLISIMSNNMTDLGESQKIGFDVKYDFGLRDKDGNNVTRLDRIFMIDKDGDDASKISKVVSYMMNASVDAAKDNYIISGNLTSYSANSMLMMTRMGISLSDLFTISMNDEILKFSRYKNYQKAKLSDYNFDYSAKELDKWSVQLLTEISKHKDGLFGVISKDDFLDNNPEKKQQILGFWNLVQEMGKEFNNSVVAMKSDSNGAGKNIAENTVLNNRLDRLGKDVTNYSEEKWFRNGRGPNDSNMRFNKDVNLNPNTKMMGAMANNTLFLMNELSEKLFIETNPNVKNTVSKIMASLGDPLSTSADTISLVYNYLYPHLLTKTGHEIYNIDENEERDLLAFFPDRLQKYKDEVKGDNQFLQHLKIPTNLLRNLIEFPQYKNFSDDDIQMFKQDIVNMMFAAKDLPEGHEYKNLVMDLAKYAFLTTGMKSTYFSYHHLIPATFYINSNHGSAIKHLMNRTDTIAHSEAMTLMAQTHYNNYKIVKNVSGNLNFKSGAALSDEKVIERIQMKNGEYAPFVQFRKLLYALTSKEDGKPIYSQITKNQSKDFNTFTFYDIDDVGVLAIDTPYVSKTSELFKDTIPNADPTISEPDAC